MKEFFKFVFASIVGVFLSFFLIILLLVALISGLINYAGKNEETTLANNSVLHIQLNYAISERSSNNPLDNFSFTGMQSEKKPGLNEILNTIEKAKDDNRIKGIYLDISNLQAGLATIEEIRNALLDFKKSKKFILAYSEIYTQGAYYLASAADKIYLNPEGTLDFSGYSSQITFYKGLLDKLEIEAQVIKVGTYKSAVEPYILDKMSEPNRAQITSYMGSLYDNFLSKVSQTRKIPKDSLFAIADDLKVQSAADAVTYKLVNALKYKDEVIEELKKLTSTAKDEDISAVSISNYSAPASDTISSSKNRIALIYASGEIVTGEGNDEIIGSDRISRAIRQARTDDKVKAVVLRVNSPGGSALASDVIWREVTLTKKVKPVIVSMGDYAASGGYYIACAADSIFAEPNTITGSIGVFGILPNMQKFFNNKLGVTFDEVKTTKFANLGNITKPLTESERLIIQNEVNRIYSGFTKHVAEGRRKTQAYVDSIGQGRVWTGSQAITNGLVDRIGNIKDAIRSAQKMAKLEDYKLVEYPAQKDPLRSLFGDAGDRVKTYFTRMELGENYIYYQQLQSAMRFSGIQARLPYNIIIN